MIVTVRNFKSEDRAEWLGMRRALWEDCPGEQQVREMDEILGSDSEEVFFAERPGGGLCGFLAVALRSRADGCDSTPVGYIEGWYVDEDVRQQGVGRALVGAAEEWARSKGCRQMASDAELWNEVSHQAHGALGYHETGRVVTYKKDLS
jgi:aminoglycoside 6'-N-acetyltransferase I